jgi:hypothetical protein
LTLDGEAARVTLTGPEGELLGEATPGNLDDFIAPEPVSASIAEQAMPHSPTHALEAASFPCFVCNPQRPDGFHVTPGPVPGRNVVAALWRPDRDLAGATGELPEEFAWAVLDCTGSIGAMVAHSIPAGVVLGRMTAEVLTPVTAGEPIVAVGWTEPADGRKLPAGAALFRESGELLARARLLCFAT